MTVMRVSGFVGVRQCCAAAGLRAVSWGVAAIHLQCVCRAARAVEVKGAVGGVHFGGAGVVTCLLQRFGLVVALELGVARRSGEGGLGGIAHAHV